VLLGRGEVDCYLLTSQSCALNYALPLSWTSWRYLDTQLPAPRQREWQISLTLPTTHLSWRHTQCCTPGAEAWTETSWIEQLEACIPPDLRAHYSIAGLRTTYDLFPTPRQRRGTLSKGAKATYVDDLLLVLYRDPSLRVLPVASIFPSPHFRFHTSSPRKNRYRTESPAFLCPQTLLQLRGL